MPAPYGLRVDRAGTFCLGGPQPGTSALRAGVLEAWATRGVFDVGIYNCRPPRGVEPGPNVRVSLHGEGRAWDAGIPAGSRSVGDQLAGVLVALSTWLGIQRVIWWHHEWDAVSRQWEPYGGEDPHESHVHSELCWAAALELTIDEVRRVFATDEEGDLDMDDKHFMELVRKVLNEGTGQGQDTWAETSHDTLAIVQGHTNQLSRLAAAQGALGSAVAQLGAGGSVDYTRVRAEAEAAVRDVLGDLDGD